MQNRYLLLTTILMLIIGLNVCLAGEVTVIANNDVTEVSLDKYSIANIYLGKKTTWSDGADIIPFMINSGQSRTDFLTGLVSKSDGDFNAFWMQNIFAGKGTPPETVSSPDAMVKKIAATPGAIGFVPAGTATAGVKTLSIK